MRSTARRPASQDEIEKLRAQLPKVPNEAVRRALEDVLDEGRATADALREGLERHFNEVMDRASGWYKRRAQLALVLIATAVTITGNVDSVQVASRLWSDDALRATVVQRANAATEERARGDRGVAEPARRRRPSGRRARAPCRLERRGHARVDSRAGSARSCSAGR